MSTTPIAEDNSAVVIDEILRRWANEWFDSGVLQALDRAETADDIGQHRWLLRLAGDEKEFITMWLTLRQRTVHIEVQLMPAPEENIVDVYRFLLTKNADLYGLHVALGPENAIYLVGRVPAGEMSAARLDELCGAAMVYVDEIFPTAMSMGLASMYRRRRRTT